jgi:DNA-binding NtrC family response regulator
MDSEIDMARILVIDDEALVRRTLRAALERAGHEVLEAKDGKEAIQHQRQTPVDLAVTDILMPDSEGLQCIRELRGLDPQIRVIAMSGGGQIKAADVLDMARRFGANRTFAKPFDVPQLLLAVQAELRTRAA